MAPINLPNGTEVSEIVLPNGQTASEVIAPDGSTVFGAIPDSGNLHAHYDLKNQPESDGETIDPLIDQTGNGRDATATGAPTMDVDGFNGEPTASLDGSNDAWEVASADWTSLSQPITIYWAGAYDGSSGLNVLTDQDSNGRLIVQWRESDTNWEIGPNSSVGAGASTDNYLGAVFDGSNSVLETQSDQSSGSATTNGLDSPGIGFADGFDANYFNGRLSAFLIYDAGHDASTRTDVFNYLIDRYSI